MVKMRQIQVVTTLLTLGSTITLSLPAMAGWLPSLKGLTGSTLSEADQMEAYRRCGKDLADAKLETAVSADACASALRPEELGRCVVDLTKKQQVTALMALEACRRVHRPLELQTCVQDIQRQDSKASVTPVLEACRQSLLPVRYGRCVVGLNQSLAVATTVGLATCLDASDRPATVQSDFIQLEQLSRFDNAGAMQQTGVNGGTSALPPATSNPPSTPGVKPGSGTTPAQLY